MPAQGVCQDYFYFGTLSLFPVAVLFQLFLNAFIGNSDSLASAALVSVEKEE